MSRWLWWGWGIFLGKPNPWHFSTAKPQEQLLCAGWTISAALLRWPHAKDGQLYTVHVQWQPHAHPSGQITWSPYCFQFVVSYHSKPVPSQCLHRLCCAAFPVPLQTEEQAHMLQAQPSTFNGLRMCFHFSKSKSFEKMNNYEEPASLH